jgi:hypothetical protein
MIILNVDSVLIFNQQLADLGETKDNAMNKVKEKHFMLAHWMLSWEPICLTEW